MNKFKNVDYSKEIIAYGFHGNKYYIMRIQSSTLSLTFKISDKPFDTLEERVKILEEKVKKLEEK